MKNFIQPGKTLDLLAPNDVLSGEAFIIGSIFAVASADALSGEDVVGEVEGVFELPNLTTNVVAVGDKLNWNNTNKELQLATSDLDGVATAIEIAGNGDVLVQVKLTPL